MTLDITSIPDREGAALYAISGHDTLGSQQLQQLCDEVKSASSNQVVLIQSDHPDARVICDFYDISEDQLPAMMIVRDDDTLVELWRGEEIPFDASDIAFRLGQVSS